MKQFNECPICKETKHKKLIGAKLILNYQNPSAHGFPEVVFWKDEYDFDTCPICRKTKIKEKDEE